MNCWQRLATSALLSLVASTLPGHATPAEAPNIATRVGGDYLVSAIDHVDNGEFRIQFAAVAPSGKFDTLTLHSNHVHVAVKIGQKLRLSAEILSTKGTAAEVAQMVIFVANPQGPVPVWLLSNRAGPRDLKATKYLEMHSPLTDYIVM
ncbi:MAG: hypothetical protein FJ146_04715 [Deltaproteobacteria bacterium]|nr:hypothetical protein [Deltaproteobacteria bacterium]